MSAADGVHGVICKELTITLEIVLSNFQSVIRSWNLLRAVKHHHTRWRGEARGASGATTSCNMKVHKAGKMFGYMESIGRHKQQITRSQVGHKQLQSVPSVNLGTSWYSRLMRQQNMQVILRMLACPHSTWYVTIIRIMVMPC